MLDPDTAKCTAESDSEIVFLDVPFDACYERISGDTNRPIVMNSTKEELEELFNKRREIYIKHSTIHIGCGGLSPIETADKIVGAIKK